MCLAHHGRQFTYLEKKRVTLRSNITRFATAVNDATEGTTLDDLEQNCNRLQETLDHPTSLDDSIHGSLNDVEYATDVESCEVYIDSAKRAIHKATRTIDSKLSASMSSMTLASNPLPRLHPLRLQLNSQPLSWNPFRASLSHDRVFWGTVSVVC